MEGLSGDARRVERRPVALPTTIRARGYHGSDVLIRDISELGFMAETHEPFPRGAYVRLKLPGAGIAMARIIWSRRGQVGGEFVNALPPARLRLAMGLTAA